VQKRGDPATCRRQSAVGGEILANLLLNTHAKFRKAPIVIWRQAEAPGYFCARAKHKFTIESI